MTAVELLVMLCPAENAQKLINEHGKRTKNLGLETPFTPRNYRKVNRERNLRKQQKSSCPMLTYILLL